MTGAPAVRATSFLLIPDGVSDLEDFVARPDTYLVDTRADPQRAADLWRARMKRHPYGSEGLVQIRYHGQDVIAADLWDEVSGIWFALLEVLEEYTAGNPAERLFPDQPVPIRLQDKGRSTLFTVGTQTTPVDPADFVPALVDEIVAWFMWVEEHIGIDESEILARARALDASR